MAKKVGGTCKKRRRATAPQLAQKRRTAKHKIKQIDQDLRFCKSDRHKEQLEEAKRKWKKQLIA